MLTNQSILATKDQIHIVFRK